MRAHMIISHNEKQKIDWTLFLSVDLMDIILHELSYVHIYILNDKAEKKTPKHLFNKKNE